MLQSRKTSGSASAKVTAALRREIIAGTFPPGLELRQEDLALRYGTSRIPVREALRVLQAEGLVTYEINRGATVAGLSLVDAMEILEVRIALECHALRLAVPKLVDAESDAANEVLCEYDAAPEAYQWAQMNWRFHSLLYAPCDCPRLLEAIEENYNHFSRFDRQQVSVISGKERPQKGAS